MATTQDTHHIGQDETDLINKTENMNLAEQGQADEAHGLTNGEHQHGLLNGDHEQQHEHSGYAAPYQEGVPLNQETIGRESPNSEYPQSEARPSLSNRVSRSYMGAPIPIVTTYEQEPENASIRKQKRSSSRASNRDYEDAQALGRSPSRVASIRNNDPNFARSPSRAASHIQTDRAQSIKNVEPIPRSASRAGSINHDRETIPRSASRAGSINQDRERPQSRIGNAIGAGVGAGGGAAVVGEIVSHDRQRSLQQQERARSVSLHDDQEDRSANRALSVNRPQSSFGHRPQPNLMTVAEDGRESRYDGRDSRAGVLGRSGTVLSRANTQGRNGTLSRAANGGTVGSRRGAFGRGAGASIGTQPEEVLGRDDIHARAELSERILDEATLRRLSTMEKKDAKRLAKVIKAEGKSESKAVSGSIKELERMVKLQKDAASAERKSQLRLTKYTSKEHKARLRFLKEKERYEKIEGELRNAENDYEERRDHAGGLTAQVAEKTQELDDLRGQKAADDREREVKLLALKNPAHS